MTVRTWTLVTAAVLLGIGILAAGRIGAADDDDAKTRATILKMADALAKGDDAGAKKMADSLTGTDLEDIMNLMLPRKANGKGGVGIGNNVGAITPDGIEKKIQDLEKKAPKADEASALERAGYIMQAISLTLDNKVPKGKKPMPWKKYSTDYQAALKTFIDAAKKKDPKSIQTASIKLNNACIACHNDYK